MSVEADRQRTAREHWALPGGAHDRVVRLLKWLLPMGVGALGAIMIAAPIALRGDVSFVLDKNHVVIANERLRLQEALYRGEDSKGRPFSLRAGSAVQKTSRDPQVEMQDLSARILMSDGPAMLVADRGSYNLDTERVAIIGPVQFQSEGGYRLITRDVGIDLRTRRMESRSRVDGRMPVGTFGGDQLQADLAARTVTLNGNARLRIDQNAIKGRGQ